MIWGDGYSWLDIVKERSTEDDHRDGPESEGGGDAVFL